MYSSYVFPERLISPRNGHTSRSITKQNITQFGFASIEELHEAYPGFPLICAEAAMKRSRNAAMKNERSSAEARARYDANPKLCLECGTKIPYEKKQGNLFCNSSCSAKHTNRTATFKRRGPEKQHKPRKPNKTCMCCGQDTGGPFSSYCASCRKDVLRAQMKARWEDREVMMAHIHRTTQRQSRRSRDEIELFRLCSLMFNAVPNAIIVKGWDADIVLPDQKIAILWNGPWHYREMKFGTHSLSQVANRDLLKMTEFEELGWEVLIYDDRSWTPMTAYIDIIIQAKNRLKSMV